MDQGIREGRDGDRKREDQAVSDPFLQELWLRTIGESQPDPEPWSLSEAYRTQWSPSFEGHMRRRLIFGSIRYGRLSARFKPQYNRIQAIRDRLTEYERTGNLTWIVDVANLALLEFVEGRHPKRHFDEKEDHDLHVKP